jgi:hypothetical protein
MTEALTRHRLEGLEPDNLLAFLALLGLLRSLELTRPDWRPRAYWDFSKSPLRPVLTTCQSTTSEAVCEAAVEGLQLLQKALFPFRWQFSSKGKRVARTILTSSYVRHRSLSKRCILAAEACHSNPQKHAVWLLRCDLIACSGVPSANDREKIEPTPLKLPSGQMPFIGAQFDLASKCKIEDVSKCLFQAWAYSFKGSSLRLSPDEAQRYAYRASDPSPEGAYTELGASALSCLGLLSFPMVETQRHWRMPGYAGKRQEGSVSWPIWNDGADGSVGASIQTIAAMLRTLPLDQTKPVKHFGPSAMIATARRYKLGSEGDYGNVSRAKIEPIPN